MGVFYWSSDWDSLCSLKDNCDTHLYLCDIWRIFFMLIDLTIKFHSHCTHFALSKCTGNVIDDSNTVKVRCLEVF